MSKITKISIADEYIEMLERAIEFHEETRGAYFKYPGSHANIRRRNEKRMNELAVNIKFEFDEILKTKSKKHTIDIRQSYSESCKNVYVQSEFYFDDCKSTITKIKNIYELC